VPDAGTVTDVNVRVRLNHTSHQNLDLRLIGPDTTTVLLSHQNGGPGQDYGSGATNCSGTFTIFDDAASAPIYEGTAPFAVTFQTEAFGLGGPGLGSYNGKAANGSWTIRIADLFAVDSGTLFCWQLEITRNAPPASTSTPTPTPTPTLVVAPTATPTQDPSVCASRPNVGVSTLPSGAGRLQVTVAAGTSSQLPNNRLSQLQFGAASNALIDTAPYGPNGQAGSFAVALPAGTQQVSFFVRRAVAGQAVTVPFVVVDNCGPWQTFVGGGASAF